MSTPAQIPTLSGLPNPDEKIDPAVIHRLDPGPIYGWRGWKITGPDEANLDDLVALCVNPLHVGSHIPWPAQGWFQGTCHASASSANPGHPTPWAACRCGIYCDKTKEAAEQRIKGHLGPIAFGKIELGGRVVVHEKGYRAQKAWIVALSVQLPEDAEWTKLLTQELCEDGLRLAGYPVVPLVELVEEAA